MTEQATADLNSTTAPALPTLGADDRKSRAAIKRCCAAWQRAYEAKVAQGQGSSSQKIVAAFLAGPAFRKAMPPLAGYDNIRDFIACTAYGILIEAIPEKRANQLLYAAQVALSTLHHGPKPQKPA